jgi:hypothetical protein
MRRLHATGHKLQLARKSGKRGGKAWANKVRLETERDFLERPSEFVKRANKARQRCLEIYGTEMFCNIVRRGPRGVRPGTKRGPYKKRTNKQVQGS